MYIVVECIKMEHYTLKRKAIGGDMMESNISDKILEWVKLMENDLNIMKFGNIDFIIHNGNITRVDLRKSMQTECIKVANRRTEADIHFKE